MPTPPTGEQQAKDMMKCTNNSDVVQALDLQGKYKHFYLQYFYFLTKNLIYFLYYSKITLLTMYSYNK